MADSIKTTSIEVSLKNVLNEYNNEVAETVKRIAEEIANDAVKMLKEYSRQGVWGRKDGRRKVGRNRYANGWRVKAEPAGMFSYSFTVYNTNGQLTHLLENAHALRGGGTWTPKQRHIKPVEEWCQTEFEARLKRALQ